MDKARKRLYATTRWREARARYLRANPVCRACGRQATVVDHMLGHGEGWRATFWLTQHWQPLCHACHSRKTVTVDMRIHEGKDAQGAFSKRAGGDGSVPGQKLTPRAGPREAPETASWPPNRAETAINLIERLKRKP
jgi:hypothetical protein